MGVNGSKGMPDREDLSQQKLVQAQQDAFTEGFWKLTVIEARLDDAPPICPLEF